MRKFGKRMFKESFGDNLKLRVSDIFKCDTKTGRHTTKNLLTHKLYFDSVEDLIDEMKQMGFVPEDYSKDDFYLNMDYDWRHSYEITPSIDCVVEDEKDPNGGYILRCSDICLYDTNEKVRKEITERRAPLLGLKVVGKTKRDRFDFQYPEVESRLRRGRMIRESVDEKQGYAIDKIMWSDLDETWKVKKVYAGKVYRYASDAATTAERLVADEAKEMSEVFNFYGIRRTDTDEYYYIITSKTNKLDAEQFAEENGVPESDIVVVPVFNSAIR